jgi:hexosaminidase
VRTLFLIVPVLTSLISSCVAQAQRMPSLMPLPARMEPGSGELVIDTSFSAAITGHKDARLQRAVELFLNDLRRQTGITAVDLRITDSPKAALAISCEQASKEIQEPGEDESYKLEINGSGAKLNAPTTLGVMRGLQTFLQLVHTGASGFAVPAVSIDDKPRFAWRGLLVDVGRHYIPIEVLKRNLDGMAAVKLNVFHWHISDYQGFRIESKKFPKLQGMGSDGLFYTQDEIRDFVAYARDRGIRVVPEFDMPGHSTSWFIGYPELASGPGPYQIARNWGVLDPAMDPTRESTYKFLDGFIGEMSKLFPDTFFHIGGDEVNGKEWDANPKIQEFKRAHGMKNNADLQAYFNERVQKILTKHGKTMVGWDEILHPDLPKSAVIQSWRGQESLAQAAKQGFRGILSSGYYLDLMWPAARHYAVDPMSDAAATLSSDEQRQILGGEACMWGEYVVGEDIDSRIWPRAAAVAERLWSPQEIQDASSMYQRMEEISQKLDWQGLTHNSGYLPMLRRMVGGGDPSVLKVLADVVEPVKEYTREDLAPVPPTSTTPLNRLIDAARPESMPARHFSELVDLLVAGKLKPGVEPQLRAVLEEWRDNYANLQPLLANSFLLKDVDRLSQNLSALGSTGLMALDYLDHGQTAPAAWVSDQLSIIEQIKKPQAQVLLVVAPSVQKLVQASGGQSAVSPAK